MNLPSLIKVKVYARTFNFIILWQTIVRLYVQKTKYKIKT